MNYVWVESDSQTQSDTTTASYAAVPAVEQTVRPQGQPAVQALFLSRQPDNPPATAQGKREGKREGGREAG